ncbi:hypothetical protein OEA41_001671 [Lepraria neglecta]|uniref:Ketoreductase domain-containing protein n=1 Tax=Lepraria neglecta TaxID=209136 RepID=A0AAD9ZAI5_9LECA|nr:hypothetical protein OEA41_001671 [Lepraria neglecta]
MAAIPAKYLTAFSPIKFYILIGGLGGLGRSLSKWMFNRGARNFGQSATDKPAEREVVQNLEIAGATVHVVRGDVINKEDVVKISGSVGTATESNCCATNAFLDAFARDRHSLGKPATSIGFGIISKIGYLHENPDIEALLLRKGIQPLNEEDFLQILDLSLGG